MLIKSQQKTIDKFVHGSYEKLNNEINVKLGWE